MIILLSYDLNVHERPEAYEAVRDMIEAHADSSIKALYSQWLIDTEDSLDVWHERMKSVTDKNDRWFILPVGTTRQGLLTKTAVEWLKAHG